MTLLKGIAWDHPRGYEPLRKLSEIYASESSGLSVEWDVRSLKEFGDTPIEDLIEQYDLITIDHPYMGQAHQNGLLVDLKGHLTYDEWQLHEKGSVGLGFQSYQYDNHLYALPIDAAAQMAAFRADLFEDLKLKVPLSWQELRDFYLKLPQKNMVAWPLCATDIWCSFLTLSAQAGGRNFIEHCHINRRAGLDALEELLHHLDYLHPSSLQWNPIQVLDHMGEKDDIIYSPYMFGYTNYSRVGYANKLVQFTNSPVHPANEAISTILGGVGLAISAKSKRVDEAVKLAKYIAHPDNQERDYTQYSGQPGHIKAWKSEHNNLLCNDFFNNTLHTLETAYIRPQHPLWNTFQERGSEQIHQGILKAEDTSVIIDQLNQLYQDTIQP